MWPGRTTYVPFSTGTDITIISPGKVQRSQLSCHLVMFQWLINRSQKSNPLLWKSSYTCYFIRIPAKKYPLP